MDVRSFTVGMVAENCYFASPDGSTQAIVVDPGEEEDRLLGAIDELGRRLRRLSGTAKRSPDRRAPRAPPREAARSACRPESEARSADAPRLAPWQRRYFTLEVAFAVTAGAISFRSRRPPRRRMGVLAE